MLTSNANWNSFSNPVAVTNGSNVVTIPLDSSNQFFRLVKP
jgi:hypothetical protein